MSDLDQQLAMLHPEDFEGNICFFPFLEGALN